VCAGKERGEEEKNEDAGLPVTQPDDLRQEGIFHEGCQTATADVKASGTLGG